MSRRLPTAAVLMALLLAPSFVSTARAQQRPDTPQPDLGPLAVSSFGQSIRLADWEQAPSLPLVPPRPPKPGASTITLNSLYASTVALQALDIHSTFSVLNNGGGEGNPVMAGVVTNKAAFIGIKAAIATGTILAARQIGKRNKMAAIVTLVAINSAYVFVVQHNYAVARSLK